MPATLHEHAVFTNGPVWGGVHHLDTDVEAHAHDFLEVAVVGGGRGRHGTSHGERQVRSGTVVVLRPGAWHGFRDCAGLTVANCCLSAQALRGELAALQDFPMLRRTLWTEPTASGTHDVAEVTVVQPAVRAPLHAGSVPYSPNSSHTRAATPACCRCCRTSYWNLAPGPG